MTFALRSSEPGLPALRERVDPNLSDRDFQRLRVRICETLGIKLHDSKKTMIQSRLLKRLRALSLDSFAAYCDYVDSPAGQQDEVVHLLDLATTNQTSFFRESDHFSFLADSYLPEFFRSGGKSLRVWSAACSTGQEPYTLAIALSEAFAASKSAADYQILGSDVSTRALERARLAVYDESDLAGVSEARRRRWFLRSRERERGQVRVVPELRAKVGLLHLNLNATNYAPNKNFNVIFLRNALIYFDQTMQQRIVSRLCEHLLPRGLFFVSHSESLHSCSLPLRSVGRSVYVRL